VLEDSGSPIIDESIVHFYSLFHSSYPTVGEVAIVGDMSDWGLLQHVGCSRNVHRFTAHERGLMEERLRPAIRSQV
jgi:hypothetical protein